MAERIAIASVRRDHEQPTHTTVEGRRRAAAQRTTRPARSVPATPKRSFRLPEVVLGVMLVAGCALGAALWQQSANETTTVVVAARPIARGSVIAADDLRGAEVGGETDAMISGNDATTLLGQVAVVDIDIGAPMTRTLLTDERPLGVDEALTSIALEPGQVPPDLAPNDHVRVVVTAAADGNGLATTTLLDATAVVWSVDPAQDGISVVVTVRGPLSLSTDVAAAGSVRLARVDG